MTALLWGAAFTHVLDHRPGRAAPFLASCAVLTLCGVIHSPLPSGALFSPLSPPSPIVWHLAAGYGVMSALFLLLDRGYSAPAAE